MGKKRVGQEICDLSRVGNCNCEGPVRGPQAAAAASAQLQADFILPRSESVPNAEIS